MSKNDGGRMNPKTFARFLLQDEPDNYADLLSRVKELYKELYKVTHPEEHSEHGLWWYEIEEPFSRIIPEAKEEGK